MSKDLAKHFLVVVSLLLIPACATVGPRITREEKQRAQALLRAEAQAWQNRQELRIHAVVARLIEAAENVKSLEFHFVAKQENTRRKINPDTVGAWTDGKGVWVTRGMVRFLKNDDELAIILGHEMAHAYKAHVEYSVARGIFGVALGAVADAFAPGTGRSVMTLTDAVNKSFDRDEEREADFYGLIWASKAGFNVDAAKNVWKRMAIERPETVEEGYLSTHPSSAERFLAMDKVGATLKKGMDPIKVYSAKKGAEVSKMKSTEFKKELEAFDGGHQELEIYKMELEVYKMGTKKLW